MIACITTNGDSFGTELYDHALGPFCYPDTNDVEKAVAYIQKHRPSAIVIDTACMGPEKSKTYIERLLKIERDDPCLFYKLFSTSGEDPNIPDVLHLPLDQIKDQLKKIA